MIIDANEKLSEQEEVMLQEGYLPARIVAKKMKMDVSSVHRLVRQGKLVGVQVGSKRYIKIDSVISYLGIAGAKILGFLEGA